MVLEVAVILGSLPRVALVEQTALGGPLLQEFGAALEFFRRAWAALRSLSICTCAAISAEERGR
jgi:hypothetical protein